MILSFALASTDAMSVNGVQYADGLWLRVAEMFVSVQSMNKAMEVIIKICQLTAAYND